MALTFPTPTTVGQTYSDGNRTWSWNGTAWQVVSNAATGRGYALTFSSLTQTISIGNKVLTLGSNSQIANSPNWTAAIASAYSVGSRIRLSANANNWMEGQLVQAGPFTQGFLTWSVNVTKISGSGTYSTWTVSIAGEPGLDGGVTSYNQLTDKPTLGTAAATDATAYATAAQGAKADLALQPNPELREAIVPEEAFQGLWFSEAKTLLPNASATTYSASSGSLTSAGWESVITKNVNGSWTWTHQEKSAPTSPIETRTETSSIAALPYTATWTSAGIIAGALISGPALSIENGGTGATTAEQARINLGITGGGGGGVTSYNDLTDLPTLGSAASTESSDYATAAQGAKADSALQSGAAISTISGLQAALDGKVSLSAGSYIIAKPGDNLATKYAEAKALNPNGAAKSDTNRASLIILPGNYSLSAELLIDEEFVDVLGLGSQMHNAAVLISNASGGVYSSNVPNVSANNVRILGIGSRGRFKITGDKPLQVFENCTSLLEGFYPTASGTFTGCRGGSGSFGGNSGPASGTFTNCSSGSASFGNVASGRFTNCTAASNYTICSGTFTNCSGGEASFGTYAAASGVFIGCTGGRYSFGSGGPGGTSNATGVFINCRQTAETFPTLTAPTSGKALMINCIDGNGNIIEGQAPL